MIKCGRCGNLNAGDVLFCQYCGTRLVEQRLPDVALVAAAPPKIEVSKKAKTQMAGGWR